MTNKTDLIREIHEYVTTHGGENTATHLLVQAASAIQTQAAELEAIGAGGVSGPLMGRASLSANAGEPRKVFLVATGEEHEGEATYTRYDDKPPPLCDSECLFAAPPTAQAEGWISVDERLPEHEQAVAFVVRTDGFQQHLNGCVLGGCFVRGQGFFVPGLGLEASHWMPLPPPPTSAEGVEHG